MPVPRRMRSIKLGLSSEWQPHSAAPEAVGWLPLLVCRVTYSMQPAQEAQGSGEEGPGASGQLPCLLAQDHQQQQQQQQGAVQWEVGDWSVETCPHVAAMWSEYYQQHARDPSETELAPWVAPLYARRRAHLPP